MFAHYRSAFLYLLSLGVRYVGTNALLLAVTSCAHSFIISCVACCFTGLSFALIDKDCVFYRPKQKYRLLITLWLSNLLVSFRALLDLVEKLCLKRWHVVKSSIHSLAQSFITDCLLFDCSRYLMIVKPELTFWLT